MNVNKDRLFFYMGSGLLIVAVAELTVLPYYIDIIFPRFLIPSENYRLVTGIIYLLAALSYLFSCSTHYRKQMLVIFVLFVFYVLFQLYVFYV